MTLALQERSEQIQRLTIGGGIGGIAGGVVFGGMMGAMGMLPMVAKLVGSSSALVGFGVHMVISLIIGLAFGLSFGWLSKTFLHGAGFGLLYGAIWWVLGPLVLMPLMLGMGLQFTAALEPGKLMSLGGHLVYGIITGLVYVAITRR